MAQPANRPMVGRPAAAMLCSGTRSNRFLAGMGGRVRSRSTAGAKRRRRPLVVGMCLNTSGASRPAPLTRPRSSGFEPVSAATPRPTVESPCSSVTRLRRAATMPSVSTRLGHLATQEPHSRQRLNSSVSRGSRPISPASTEAARAILPRATEPSPSVSR